MVQPFLTELDHKIKNLVYDGYSANTHRTYSASQKKYLSFCAKYGLQPVPASDTQIRRYIAYLSSEIAPSSIRVYLAAVRALHVDSGLTFSGHAHPQAQVMIRGLLKGGPPPTQKNPITVQMLEAMGRLLHNCYDHVMLWAAMCLAFFACLRADELTYSAESPGVPLIQDITHKVLPSGDRYFTLTVHRSKTEPHGFTRVVGCTGNKVCGYCSMSKYLLIRQKSSFSHASSSLFMDSKGQILSFTQFNQATKHLVASMGINVHNYSGHSFRVGCASVAGASGFKDWEIQLLGGWRSDTYKRYIRQTESHAVSFARRLVNSTG